MGLHDGHRERLRERFMREGLANFEQHQVLELLLTYAIPQKDVNPLAHQLIERFGSLPNVLNADAGQLIAVPGIKDKTAAFLRMIPQLERYLGTISAGKSARFDNARTAGEYCAALLKNMGNECFALLSLDARLRLIRAEILQQGADDSTVVYVRQVMDAALRNRAASVILTHNHPSGLMSPSQEDIDTTSRIITALNAVEIAVVDHIIVGGGKYFSMRHMIEQQADEPRPAAVKFASPDGSLYG